MQKHRLSPAARRRRQKWVRKDLDRGDAAWAAILGAARQVTGLSFVRLATNAIERTPDHNASTAVY